MVKKQDRYREAGVDIDLADRLVDRILPMAHATYRKGVVGDIGGFGGLFSPRMAGYRDPVLVSGTDGVGTKLKIAQTIGKHDTVGIDLVAMCANDVVTCGAEPLFFLDYFATGKLDINVGQQVIKGIADGCRMAGCALIGGETAEMPGFYAPGEYDLAGFVVGAVERKKILDASKTKPGDVLIGIASSGLHSNGFSLVRKVFVEERGYSYKSRLKGLKTPLGLELLKPTRIYVKTVLEMTRRFKIRGVAHITGGGITENTPRVFPKGLSALIKRNSWKPQPIFKILQQEGGVNEAGMYRTFNMGIGLIMVVSRADAQGAVKLLKRKGERVYIIGEVVKDSSGPQVIYDPPLE